MVELVLDVGILFSSSGSYRTIGRSMLAGALLAVDEVNDDPGIAVRLRPHVVDPGGILGNYVSEAQRLLANSGLLHVVGCYTSSSRKEVLPVFEKHDALLWYPSHYEGFETSDSVIYTGAAPNQHIVPLTRYVLQNHGNRAWLVGSNYIWAWENNRIMREALLADGGAVLGERCLTVGETDIDGVVDQILGAKPDFVFNTLIGESAYAFFRRLRQKATERGLDQVRELPVVSCSLSEPELVEIGPAACDGHLSSSVYFETVGTPENQRFVAAWRGRFPDIGPTSADAEASYIAVHLLARAVAAAGSKETEAVREAVAEIAFTAPQGPVRVDAENRHCHLRPRIGRSTADAQFEIIYEAAEPVRPDPYLIWHSAVQAKPAARSIRIVS